MKVDADEKQLLESVKRSEWKSVAGNKRERTRCSRYAKATFSEGPPTEYPAVEQGSGGDSEASARRGLALSDVNREPATQVRDRAAQAI
jgi:hypothetical protein